MPTQINNYKCPACTGPLRFDGKTQKLVCDYCGSTYTIEEVEKLYAEKEKAAEEQYAKEKEKEKEQQAQTQQDSGMEPEPAAIDVNGNAKPNVATSAPAAASGQGEAGNSGAAHNSDSELWGAGMKSYTCPSCGAELICDENTAATCCPYCGNPTVVPGQFAGGKKPDYIIPFKLSKEDAVNALKKHYGGKKLLPSAFSDQNHIDEIKGVYVPFWLYDLSTEAGMSFEGTNSTSFREGKYMVTSTDHYEVERRGVVPFEKIPSDASSKMPDDYMDSIEPYDYSELKPFSNAYLPGFLADKYDVEPGDGLQRVIELAENSAANYIRSQAEGYSTLVETGRQIRTKNPKTWYCLMPVWLLSTRWNGKSYLFAMNGQTGKLVGDLPMDKGKYWKYFALTFAVAFAACFGLTWLF